MKNPTKIALAFGAVLWRHRHECRSHGTGCLAKAPVCQPVFRIPGGCHHARRQSLAGALGHTADEEGHEVLRSQVDETENLRDDARNLKLFEQAREWFLEDKE